MWTKATAGTAIALAVSTSLVLPAAASGGPDGHRITGGSDTLVTSGVCDAGSTWTMEGRSRYLRVEVEARIRTKRSRQRWTLRLSHNQITIATLTRKPTGSGEAKLKGRVENQPGPDTFTFSARNRATGETCQGTLAF